MANDKAFRIKNGLSATRYLLSNGVETAGSENLPVGSATFSGFFDPTGSNTVHAFFKPDGTVGYFLIGSVIYQHTLSTAWDITTAVYASKSYDVSGQDSVPFSLWIDSTGTHLYVNGGVSDTIYQYSMSTAWDISTASYSSKSIFVQAQDTENRAIFFKPDRSKFFMAGGATQSVYAYTMSTAGDLATASYDNVSFSAISQQGDVSGLAFSSDGTTMLVCGRSPEGVHQYALSTAWDLSTATYSSSFLNTTSNVTTPYGVYYADTAYSLYVADESNVGGIYQYSLLEYTQTLDLSTGNYFSFTPSGATTVSFTNAPALGLAVGFSVEVNGNGSAITWPTSVKWHLATAPTATANKELYTFVTTDGGTTYYGKKAAEGLA